MDLTAKKQSHGSTAQPGMANAKPLGKFSSIHFKAVIGRFCLGYMSQPVSTSLNSARSARQQRVRCRIITFSSNSLNLSPKSWKKPLHLIALRPETSEVDKHPCVPAFRPNPTVLTRADRMQLHDETIL